MLDRMLVALLKKNGTGSNMLMAIVDEDYGEKL